GGRASAGVRQRVEDRRLGPGGRMRRPEPCRIRSGGTRLPAAMSGIDDLAPDQRAVLQLLLKQGKAYVELAALLRIAPDAVRERAAAALDELGPREGAQLAPERRAEIADYLLGQ